MTVGEAEPEGGGGAGLTHHRSHGPAAPSLPPGRLATGRHDLLRARDGDQAAFVSLLQAHESRVFMTAWRILGERADAEDVAQEVFLRLFDNLRRLDPDRPLEPWLYRVTVNTCLKLLRKRRIRQMVSLDWLSPAEEPQCHDHGSDPSALAELRQEQGIAERALATLPVKERLALVLRDIQGLTTRQVAAVLGSSQTTVRSQISRARLKVRAFRERVLRRIP